MDQGISSLTFLESFIDAVHLKLQLFFCKHLDLTCADLLQ